MKQQDWIDFFQAVNGRNPSIQEMAEAAQKGEFVRETPKQTVEVTEPVPQKETVETTNGSEVVEPTKPAPSTEVVETAEKDVDNYDVAEEPLTNSTADEEETFQATNLCLLYTSIPNISWVRLKTLTTGLQIRNLILIWSKPLKTK